MVDQLHHAAHIRSLGPLGSLLDNYDRKGSPSKQDLAESSADLQIFIDAMKVREEVFVHEQGVPLENEFDEDDARSMHLVLYDDKDGQREPVGTIRIVPDNIEIHTDLDEHRKLDGSPYQGEVRSSTWKDGEIHIKFGRLAVVSRRRGCRYASELVKAAVQAYIELSAREPQPGRQWNGLILVHAQKQVEGFWARHGFVLDEAMGLWDEEGIDHIAMWRRVDCSSKLE